MFPQTEDSLSIFLKYISVTWTGSSKHKSVKIIEEKGGNT